MYPADIRFGIRIRTVAQDELENPPRITRFVKGVEEEIGKELLDARKGDTIGTVSDFVTGYDGQVWIITHDDGSRGIYLNDEFTKF